MNNTDSSLKGKRGFITLSVMLATVIQTLDTTIANVTLPHMRGAMGATQDQISWVLTSYIVAAAIAMPLTAFVAARIGRKRLFLYSVMGFTLASVCCGAAQSLNSMVAFRLLQGICGACLMPLSQAILLDTYPREQHSSAMAMWGIGVMVGPIMGPSLGGWLTEYYNWRFVFYINLPFGVLACLGILAFVKETELDKNRHFDLFGFSLLALAIGALQLGLDRGESQNWFSSDEIIIELLLAAVAFYMFVVHLFTSSKTPFLNVKMFHDKNFVVGLLFSFIMGVILLATMTLLPPFLQDLMGYPVLDTGLVLSPRGFGTMAGMIIVGKIANRIDLRVLISIGLMMVILSMWEMTQFSVEITNWQIIKTGLIQGFGVGLTFVPLSALTFSTLAPSYRNEGTALFSLIRNIGSSIGISIVVTYLAHRSQINHSVLTQYVTPYNDALNQAVALGQYDISTTAGLEHLNRVVNQQASTLAYLHDFYLMMVIGILMLPLLLLLRKPEK